MEKNKKAMGITLNSLRWRVGQMMEEVNERNKEGKPVNSDETLTKN